MAQTVSRHSLPPPRTKPEADVKHHGPPFQFLNLPNEIQLNVIEKHYEGSKLSLQPDAEGSLTCKTYSSMKLERVCKHVREMFVKVRNGKIERILTSEVAMLIDNFVQISAVQPKFEWIRSDIEDILFPQAPDFPSPPD